MVIFKSLFEAGKFVLKLIEANPQAELHIKLHVKPDSQEFIVTWR